LYPAFFDKLSETKSGIQQSGVVRRRLVVDYVDSG
jgi:hypothetical protein